MLASCPKSRRAVAKSPSDFKLKEGPRTQLLRITGDPNIDQALFHRALPPGGPSFVLTVNGSDFSASSLVIRKRYRPPDNLCEQQPIKKPELQAPISPRTVPNGAATSNVAYFAIINPAVTHSWRHTFTAYLDRFVLNVEDHAVEEVQLSC